MEPVATDYRGSPPGDGAVRVATLNAFGMRENGAARRAVMAAGFSQLGADLIALQEVIAHPEYDQVRDVLSADYTIAHHGERESDGQGISIASRWPISAVHEVGLHLGPRPAGFACSALIAEIDVSHPVGRLVFVNHLPDWQLDHEAERERQTFAVAEALERLVGDDSVHMVIAGEMDATPEAASIHFWTGRQSLNGLSVSYRDAWAACHPGEPGHTFTPENTLLPQPRADPARRGLPTAVRHRCRRCVGQHHFGVTADLSAFTPVGRPVPGKRAVAGRAGFARTCLITGIVAPEQLGRVSTRRRAAAHGSTGSAHPLGRDDPRGLRHVGPATASAGICSRGAVLAGAGPTAVVGDVLGHRRVDDPEVVRPRSPCRRRGRRGCRADGQARGPPASGRSDLPRPARGRVQAGAVAAREFGRDTQAV